MKFPFPGTCLRNRVAQAITLVDSSDGTNNTLLSVGEETGLFHEERWQAVMASIPRGSTRPAVLRAVALNREALYQDQQ